MWLLKHRGSVLIALVVCFGLYANLDVIKREVRKSHRPRLYEEVLYEAYLAPVRAALPRDAIVGYVTDPNIGIGPRVTYFFLTQYNLSPVLVAEGKDYPLVIGGFYGIDEPQMSEAVDLTLLEDFGHGIRLYRGRK